MDVEKALRDLYAEKKRIERAIARLEGTVRGSASRSTRGRKIMGEEERREVSRRMKAYWAARRGRREETPEEPPQSGESGPSV